MKVTQRLAPGMALADPLLADLGRRRAVGPTLARVVAAQAVRHECTAKSPASLFRKAGSASPCRQLDRGIPSLQMEQAR